MWGIRGRVMPLASDPSVAGSAKDVFTGHVWIADDGTVAAVTKSRQRRPAGFEAAHVVDVGTDLVLPGLIDLHNHLAYNTLPLWTEPTQTTPFAHHNSWPRAKSYATGTTWPAYALITACPQELLAYVETKAIVGGVTAIEGSPPMNRPRDGWLVRNIEDESFGTGDRNAVFASVLTAKPAVLAARANRMRSGSAFIYHCGEGRRGSIAAREWTDAAAAGCLQDRFIAVHANAVDPTEFTRWSEPGAIAWSPFSNLWLYGETTAVPEAMAAGVTVCLGSDWAPSGTKNLLGELKAARVTADHLGWSLSDHELVMMATANPGDVLARAWNRQSGRLQPGALADVLVLDGAGQQDPWAAVVAATERDVRLVVVAGSPRYGTAALMSKAGAREVASITVAGRSRRLALTHPTTADRWTWDSVVDRLEAVRAHPRAEVEQALQAYAAWAGALDSPEAPLRLALDMPTGLAPVGGLPRDLDDLVVPPLQSLHHDRAWFTEVAARGFHGGVLDSIAGYYP